ncbi:MAG: hypothetical protein AAGB18_06000 [Pseudomonadota bacterium]
MLEQDHIGTPRRSSLVAAYLVRERESHAPGQEPWIGKQRRYEMRETQAVACPIFLAFGAQTERLRLFVSKSCGKPRVDERRVLSADFLNNRNGLQRRDAPAAETMPNTLYTR